MNGNIIVAKDDGIFQVIILVLQDIGKGMMVFVVFAGLDFDGKNRAIAGFDDKIHLSLFLIVEIVKLLESLGLKFLGDHVFIDGAIVDIHFAAENAELDAVCVLISQQADIILE